MSRDIDAKVWVPDRYLNQVRQKTMKQVADDNKIYVRYDFTFDTREEAEAFVTERQKSRVSHAESNVKKERYRLAAWEKKLAAIRAVAGDEGGWGVKMKPKENPMKVGKSRKIKAPVTVSPKPVYTETMTAKYDDVEITLSAEAISALVSYGREVCRAMQVHDAPVAHCWTCFTFQMDGLDPVFFYGGCEDDLCHDLEKPAYTPQEVPCE